MFYVDDGFTRAYVVWKKIGGHWIFWGASDFSNLLAPWASDSRSLMLRAVMNDLPVLHDAYHL